MSRASAVSSKFLVKSVVTAPGAVTETVPTSQLHRLPGLISTYPHTRLLINQLPMMSHGKGGGDGRTTPNSGGRSKMSGTAVGTKASKSPSSKSPGPRKPLPAINFTEVPPPVVVHKAGSLEMEHLAHPFMPTSNFPNIIGRFIPPSREALPSMSHENMHK